MAGVPITFQGIMYPKNKTDPPYAFTALGIASITGLKPGGGPILPPDQVPEPEPPLEIWPNPPEGTAPLPEHPIVLPDPIIPPDKPPAIQSSLLPCSNPLPAVASTRSLSSTSATPVFPSEGRSHWLLGPAPLSWHERRCHAQ